MKKLLFLLCMLPVGAMAQLTFDPFVSFGQVKEAPAIRNGHIAKNNAWQSLYDGDPGLTLIADVYKIRSWGYYFGGGFNIGIKNFPIALQMEVVGEHFNLVYSTHSQRRESIYSDFVKLDETGYDVLHYFRFSPTVVYKVTTRKGIMLQAQAGASFMKNDDLASMPGLRFVSSYTSFNCGVGIGCHGILFNLQANFGTRNMLREYSGYNFYSQRFTAGFNIYPKQLAQSLQ